jgi:hypothetical protein
VTHVLPSFLTFLITAADNTAATLLSRNEVALSVANNIKSLNSNHSDILLRVNQNNQQICVFAQIKLINARNCD